MAPRSFRPLRLVLRALAWLVAVLLALLMLFGVALYVPAVQNAARKPLLSWLRNTLDTRVELGALHLRFPIGVSLHGLKVFTPPGDTLLVAGRIAARLDVPALLDRNVRIADIHLDDVVAELMQDQEGRFNFQFIVDAFSSGSAPADTTTGPSAWSVSFADLHVRRLRYRMEMEPSALGLAVRLDTLDIDLEAGELAPLRFRAHTIRLRGADVAMHMVPGEDTPDTYPDLEPILTGIDVGARRAELGDLRFTLVDRSSGGRLSTGLAEAHIAMTDMDLGRSMIAVDEAVVRGPWLTIAGDTTRPAATTVPAPAPWRGRNDGFRYWVRDMAITCGRLHLSEGRLALHSGPEATPTGPADADHLVWNAIALDASGARYRNDGIAVSVDRLQATPQVGPVVELRLQADLRPDRMRVDNGSVHLSDVDLDFAADVRPGSLEALLDSLPVVPARITVDADLVASAAQTHLEAFGIHLGDAHLPARRLQLHAMAEGGLQRVDSLRLAMDGDEGTRVRLRGSATGLDDPARSTFHADIDPVRCGEVPLAYIASVWPEGGRSPRRAVVEGRVRYQAGDGEVDLHVRSDVGDLDVAAAFDGSPGEVPASATARIDLRHMAVHRITGDTAVAPLDASLAFQGTDLGSPRRVATLDGRIGDIKISGNQLGGIDVHGWAAGDSLRLLVADTTAPLDFALDVRASLNTLPDSLHLAARLDAGLVDLQQAGLMERPLAFSGPIDLDVRWASDSTLLLGLSSDTVLLHRTGERATIAGLDLRFQQRPGAMTLELESDALRASAFSSADPGAVADLLKRWPASGFAGDALCLEEGGEMQVDVELPRTDWLTRVVAPEVRSIRLSTCHAALDATTGEMDIDLQLDELDIDDLRVDSLKVMGSSDGHEPRFEVRLGRAAYGEQSVGPLVLRGAPEADSLTVDLQVPDTSGMFRYRVMARIAAAGEELGLRVGPEAPILAGRTWRVEQGGSFKRSAQGLRLEDLVLTNGTERVEAALDEQEGHVKLSALRLGTVLDLITRTDSLPTIDGILDGTVAWRADGRLNAALDANGITWLSQELGAVRVKAEGNLNGAVQVQAASTLERNRIQAEGTVDLGGEAVDARGALAVAIEDLAPYAVVMRDQVREVGGGLRGEVRLEGLLPRPRLNGTLTTDRMRVRPVFTGSLYTLPAEQLRVDARGVALDRVTIMDTLGGRFIADGRVGVLDGAQGALDLSLTTDRFELVDAAVEDSLDYYGRLLLGLDLEVGGTLAGPVVRGSTRLLGGSAFSIVLPEQDVELETADGVVEFRSRTGAEAEADRPHALEALNDTLQALFGSVDVDVRVLVEPGGQYGVVLDRATGDSAAFSGRADLRVRLNERMPLTLDGRFNILNGSYAVELYGLVKRQFSLDSTSYMVWDGDPLTGRMRLNAHHPVTTSALPLVSSANGAEMTEGMRNRLQAPLPFDVVVHIEGTVSSPEIGFSLGLDEQYRRTYPEVSDRLDQLARPEQDEERDRQVFALLVLGGFIEGGGAADAGEWAARASRSTLNNILSEQLNRFAGEHIKGIRTNIGINTYDQVQGQSTYQRTAVDLSVGKQFLDGRLDVQVGSTLGIDQVSDQTGTVHSTQTLNYAVTYLLTPNGRYRLKGFQRNAYDLFDGDIMEGGLGVIYSVELEENQRARDRDRKQAAGERKLVEDAERRKEEEQRRLRRSGTESTPSGP
ncbi:MAG TPA: translocation/assembly module TamB domain-containing protein [Flavobacteriales bacterium]|nr:translocation/assembly module TamB domain-containing protein [Flavobacteriales bacterium]HMR26579.1 translocation/assembly module TamB domain-containing protein [Flavobacteriales bacterium]